MNGTGNASLEAGSGPGKPPAGRLGAKIGLVAVLSGAVLMGLEVSGSRVLSPHFGGSIYVWGALLTVFLAGLAAGYYAGGRIADRHPRPDALGFIAGAAGIAVLSVPVMGEPVCAGLAGAGPRWGPLAAAAALFLVPGFLMGMVSPFCFRLYASDLRTAGSAAGKLYMLSTVGSLCGTFAATFLLIRVFSTQSVMTLFGLSMIAAGAVVMNKKSPSFAIYAASAAVLATVILTFPKPVISLSEDKSEASYVIEEVETPYHRIFVVEGESLYGFDAARYLQFDKYKESGIILKEPYDSATKYTDLFHLALLFNERPENVLFLGGGGMMGPRMFADSYPFIRRLDVVEIDPAVVDIAERHFYFRKTGPIEVHTSDGRVFLQGTDRTYDVVVLDIFSAGGRIPFHMTTVEFLSLVRERLSPSGVCVMNVISSVEGAKSKVFAGMRMAFERVFGQTYSFPRLYHRIQTLKEFDRDVSRNVFLAGTMGGERIPAARLADLGGQMTRDGRIPSKFEIDMHSRNLLPPDDPPHAEGIEAPTDEFNPIELWKFW